MNGLSALRSIATRNVIKQFANKYHLVYFGSVDMRSDEHQLVRGVTAATTHVDSHYTVGTFNGHDLLLVERTNLVEGPDRSKTKHHWLIMQLDVDRRDLPHVFIDSHHDAAFHANLSIAHSKLRDVTSLLPKLGHAKVLAPVERLDEVSAMVTTDLVTAMHSFSHFDFEINDDQVFIYAHNPNVNATLLTDMLRVGSWLADYIDGK